MSIRWSLQANALKTSGIQAFDTEPKYVSPYILISQFDPPLTALINDTLPPSHHSAIAGTYWCQSQMINAVWPSFLTMLHSKISRKE